MAVKLPAKKTDSGDGDDNKEPFNDRQLSAKLESVRRRLEEIEVKKARIDERQDKIDSMALETLNAADFFGARINALECLDSLRQYTFVKVEHVQKVNKNDDHDNKNDGEEGEEDETTGGSGSSLGFDGSYKVDEKA